MPKSLISLCLIYSIMFLSFTGTSPAQVPTEQAIVESSAPSAGDTTKPVDIGKAIALENERHLKRAGEFHAKAMDRGQTQLPKTKFWTKKNTVIVVLVTVGLAALTYVLIRYGKDCIKSDPAGCTPGVDDNCTCTEYAPRK